MARYDPFGPYPDQPYPGTASQVDDVQTPTDPTMRAIRPADEGFDPFAPDAYWFPERPWYRRRPATAALVTIGLALAAIVVASVLLVALDREGSQRPTVGTSTSATTAATTTPLTSSRPPEPPPPMEPPPPPPPPPPAQTADTYVPPYPVQTPRNTRPNITTPQTRPPDISVRPTHRPAFPNQPGSG